MTDAFLNHTDEQLMALIRERNREAFAVLYDRYSARLMGYFMKMLANNRELCEDLLQELFLKIARQPELFDTDRIFRPWVYTIAQNLCKMEYRKKSTRGVAVALDVTHELTDSGRSQSDTLDRKEFMTRLREVLLDIGEPHKSTFVMRYFEELSLKEISDIHHCSEGTVKSRLFYTIRKIAARLPQFKHLVAS